MTSSARSPRPFSRSPAPDRIRQRRALRNAVNSILAQSASLDGAITRVLRLIGGRQKWQRAGFWIVDPLRQELQCRALWRQPGWKDHGFSRLSRARVFSAGVGLSGRAWARRQPVWTTDLARDRDLERSASAAREGLHTALAVPVLGGQRVLGVMEFFSARRLPPDGEVLEDVLAIASLFGHFVERVRAQDAVVASEARKSAIVRAALDAIITMDARGAIVEFNPAAERIFGYRAHDVIGKELADLLIPAAHREQHRSALARCLRIGTGPLLGRRVEMTALRAGGTEFPVEVAITQIPQAGPPLFTGFVRDITAERDAARRTGELQAITAALSEALTPVQVADVILSRAAGAVGAAGGAVYVAGGDGTSLQLLGLAGPVDALKQQPQLSLTSAVPVVSVYRTRTPVFAASRSAMSSELAEMATSFPSEAARVLVPLTVGRRTLGVLWYLFSAPRTFDDTERRFVLTLADQCAQALERAQLYAREHRAAATLQRALLPATLPDMPGIRIRASYEAALRKSAVGGDWYDAFQLSDGRIVLSVGDVVGHGLQAAVVMGQARQAVRAAALQIGSPGAVLQQVNEVLRVTHGAHAMATAVLGYLDPALGTLTYAAAGHPLPILRLADGGVRMLPAAGLPLGVARRALIEEADADLPGGALLLLYSDGLIEVERNPEAGEAALREVVARDAVGRSFNPAEEIVRGVLRGRPPADDVVALTATLVDEPRRQFRLRLPATADASRMVRQTLQRFLADVVAERDRRDGFLIAVGEAVNNVVEHAYPLLDGVVEISARRGEDRATVEVADRGRWRTADGPGRSGHRGHGLVLMRRLADEVEIRQTGGGTRVTLTLRTPG